MTKSVCRDVASNVSKMPITNNFIISIYACRKDTNNKDYAMETKEIKGFKNLFQDGVKIVTDLVEETHKAFSEKTFNTIEQGLNDSEVLKTIKQTHDNITGKVYDSIREVNQTIDSVVDKVIENDTQSDEPLKK